MIELHKISLFTNQYHIDLWLRYDPKMHSWMPLWQFLPDGLSRETWGTQEWMDYGMENAANDRIGEEPDVDE